MTIIYPCLGLRGDGYTKIDGTLNSRAYHNLLQYRVLPEVRAGNGGTLDGHGSKMGQRPMHLIWTSDTWQISLVEGSLLGGLRVLEGETGLPGALISTHWTSEQGGYLAETEKFNTWWEQILQNFDLKLNSHLFYGIWGILKSRVFSPRPQTLLQLKVRLDQEVATLAADQGLLRWIHSWNGIRLHLKLFWFQEVCPLNSWQGSECAGCPWGLYWELVTEKQF